MDILTRAETMRCRLPNVLVRLSHQQQQSSHTQEPCHLPFPCFPAQLLNPAATDTLRRGQRRKPVMKIYDATAKLVFSPRARAACATCIHSKRAHCWRYVTLRCLRRVIDTVLHGAARWLHWQLRFAYVTLYSAKAITVPHRIVWSCYTDHW